MSRMRELAEACDAALSTMTGIVDRLIKQGLAQRQHSEADRRVVLTRLSGRGRLVYQERLDADMHMVLSMLQPLQAPEQRQLVTLQKIVHALPPKARHAPERNDTVDDSAGDHAVS